MSISANVVIMTRAELQAIKDAEFHRGVERGRFEQRCDDAKAYQDTPDRSGTAREAPSTTLGTLSSVGPQAAGQLPSQSQR